MSTATPIMSTQRACCLGRKCVVCHNLKATHAFFPCGHLCVCAICGLDLIACPLCGVDIEGGLEIKNFNNISKAHVVVIVSVAIVFIIFCIGMAAGLANTCT